MGTSFGSLFNVVLHFSERLLLSAYFCDGYIYIPQWQIYVYIRLWMSCDAFVWYNHSLFWHELIYLRDTICAGRLIYLCRHSLSPFGLEGFFVDWVSIAACREIERWLYWNRQNCFEVRFSVAILVLLDLLLTLSWEWIEVNYVELFCVQCKLIDFNQHIYN